MKSNLDINTKLLIDKKIYLCYDTNKISELSNQNISKQDTN